MSQVLSRALEAAFSHPSPDDRVAAIKAAITGQLEQTDTGARIRHTEYFNNTIAPDLVMHWPRENRERLVFLRPSPVPTYFTEDLEWISPSKPLVITLNPAFDDGSRDSFDELRQVAVSSDTLVADPKAIGELGERNSTEPAAGLMAQAVLRGGRGILDEKMTREAISKTVEGFHGAELVNLEKTRQATNLVSSLLQPEQAGRISRVLQSVWEGHGGSAAHFPGSPSLSGAMSEGDLEFLLENVPTRSTDFWHRIGRGITAAQIGRLQIRDHSTNFQLLIRANSDVLLAKAMRVLRRQRQLGEEHEGSTPYWITSRGCIVLRGDDWEAHIAPNSINELPKNIRQDGPSLNDVRDRADSHGTVIGNLKLDTGDRLISYSSKAGEDVLHDERITQLVGQPTVRVSRATLALPGGSRLICDFNAMTASGQTSATFAVGNISKFALPILMRLREEDDVYLESLNVSLVQSVAAEQQELDLDLDLD